MRLLLYREASLRGCVPLSRETMTPLRKIYGAWILCTCLYINKEYRHSLRSILLIVNINLSLILVCFYSLILATSNIDWMKYNILCNHAEEK
jgi:hypothetical protein